MKSYSLKCDTCKVENIPSNLATENTLLNCMLCLVYYIAKNILSLHTHNNIIS